MKLSSLICAFALVGGCRQNQQAQGPLERAGKHLDHAAEKTGQALKTAAEKTGEGAEKGAQATGKAFEKIGDKLDGKGSDPSPERPAPKTEQATPQLNCGDCKSDGHRTPDEMRESP